MACPGANYSRAEIHIMTISDQYPDIMGLESLRPSPVHMITWAIDGHVLMMITQSTAWGYSVRQYHSSLRIELYTEHYKGWPGSTHGPADVSNG